MQVVNAESAMDALWEMFSALKDDIPIYKQTVDEDETNLPDSYLLIRSDITNSAGMFGDGKALLRRSEGDVILISKTAGATSDDIHNLNIAKVKALLDASDAAYEGYNLGYNDTLKESQYTWSVRFLYGGE
ncbi:MAG: hypothetical protein K2N23_07000 [Clostridia bacterium]|nr:hypothetical protein [Clostridia bacterium]